MAGDQSLPRSDLSSDPATKHKFRDSELLAGVKRRDKGGSVHEEREVCTTFRQDRGMSSV